MDRIHSLQVTKQYQEAKNSCEALLRGELKHRCENAEFWIQFAHIEEVCVLWASFRIECWQSGFRRWSVWSRMYLLALLSIWAPYAFSRMCLWVFHKEGYACICRERAGWGGDCGGVRFLSGWAGQNYVCAHVVCQCSREEQECGSVQQEGERRGKGNRSPGRVTEKGSNVKHKKGRVVHKREKKLSRRTKQQEFSSDSESFTIVLSDSDTSSPDADSKCETPKSQLSPYRSRRLREERTPISVRKSPRLHNHVDYGKMLWWSICNLWHNKQLFLVRTLKELSIASYISTPLAMEWC